MNLKFANEIRCNIKGTALSNHQTTGHVNFDDVQSFKTILLPNKWKNWYPRKTDWQDSNVLKGSPFLNAQVARLDFLGGQLPCWNINYVGTSKEMEKRLQQLYYMIWALLQSESPWQRNDATTFFFNLCVSLCQEFFLKKSLKGVCAYHNCLNIKTVKQNTIHTLS